MINNKNIIKIKFSEKYERGLKFQKLRYPITLLIPLFIVAFFTKNPFTFIVFIALPLYFIVLLIAYSARLTGEGRLPTKVRIDDNGIYAWKRNKKEEFISWDKVHKIRVMDNITPDDYIVIINKKGGNSAPGALDYHELALDYNAAQVAIAKFDEYNKSHGILPDYQAFIKNRNKKS